MIYQKEDEDLENAKRKRDEALDALDSLQSAHEDLESEHAYLQRTVESFEGERDLMLDELGFTEHEWEASGLQRALELGDREKFQKAVIERWSAR